MELFQNGTSLNQETTQLAPKPDPFAEIMQCQEEEIEKYKWIESAKAGHDIGWNRAVREWMQNHFPQWKRHHWDRAVEDALQDNLDDQATEETRVYVKV